jgi:hypothetical protein
MNRILFLCAPSVSPPLRCSSCKCADEEAEAEAHELAALNEDEELPLTLEAGGLLDKAAMQLCEVGFQYPGSDELLFTGADFTLDR